ncbi:MAG: hypothetical protein ACTTJ6_08290 [Treponema sp.]
MLKKIIVFFILCCFFSCKQEQEGDVTVDNNTVTVNFFNESSYKVDVYRNINPSSLDNSTPPIATIAPSGTCKVKLPPSENQLIGDVFYIHYYVQLADSFSSGTGEAIYVQADRDISNIAFVLKDGMTYTKKVVQPDKNQLRFINGYVKVQNTGDKSFQVMQGSIYLKKLGTSEPNLSAGSFGFYELAIPTLEENVNMNNLKFYITATGTTMAVPSFILQRGKVYNFQFNGTEITGPSVQDITF